MQKLDPYLNVDPGTMNPFQHGEVFVTEDGAETDLDVGHYERFLDRDLHGRANVTTGQVYSTVIAKERRGEYLGDTGPGDPAHHQRDQGPDPRHGRAGRRRRRADVVITEVGGTVGDIESLPFLEAVPPAAPRGGPGQLLLPARLAGALPRAVRGAEDQADPALRRRAAQHRHPARRAGAAGRPRDPRRHEAQDQPHVRRGDRRRRRRPDAPSIYDIPRVLHREGLDAYVVRRLSLPFRDVDWTVWGDLLDRVHHPDHTARIALVGKYVDLPDAYLSVTEALRAGGFAHRAKVEIVWVPSDDCRTPAGAAAALEGMDGVLVPGGFGVRGIEGKLGAPRHARTRGLPTLGLCLGLQCMVIEAARSLAGLDEANSTEFDERTPHPVISTMADQRDVVAGERDMGGTMRLGAYPAALAAGSVVAGAYGSREVSERHRHRYEVNNAYRSRLEEVGLVFGTSPDGKLVEFVELAVEDHPFYVGTQAHPELKSRPTRPHPLFSAFIGAALRYRAADRLPVEMPTRERAASAVGAVNGTGA
jgi:CTP synthase